MSHTLHFLTASLLITTLGAAQTNVVVRDKLVALPPFSICQDGATHATIATGHRLRANGFDLSKFVGMPVQVSGTSGAVTCKFVTVTAIAAISFDQRSVPSQTTTMAKVEFFGVPNNVYALYVGALASQEFFLPSILGPIHLDPNVNVFLGTHGPTSTTKPYLTLMAPLTKAIVGVDFFDQAVVVTSAGGEMTNVDTFKF